MHFLLAGNKLEDLPVQDICEISTCSYMLSILSFVIFWGLINIIIYAVADLEGVR